MENAVHKIVKGTFLLTAAGFITRILGFFYKIYLADLLGAHYLGVYQLIFPVYAICFTIYGAGIQTAISQVIAAQNGSGRKENSGWKLFCVATGIAMFFAVSLQYLIWWKAEWIALHFVMEPSLAPYLKIMTVFFPFCCLGACINGYYYGIQDARIPAITQIIEQTFRMLFVFGITMLFFQGASPEENCRIAIWGLAAGEISSCIYNVWKISCYFRKNEIEKRSPEQKIYVRGMRSLLWLSSTLTLTRLFITLLNSIESVLLPAMLRKYGYSSEMALSIYGILTGMTLAFLLFPSTITNSMAVLLVPSIAEADAGNDRNMIRKSLFLSVHYCLLLGIFCTGVFLAFGHELGTVIFHSELCGDFLVVLSWLCPFMYLGTTLTSVINGLKKTHISFLITVVSLVVKILFLIYMVPVYGIQIYLIGFLVSQLIQVLFEGIYLAFYLGREREDSGGPDLFHGILLPVMWIIPCCMAAKSSYRWFGSCFQDKYSIIGLGLAGMICLVSYGCGLYISGCLIWKPVPHRR